MELQKILTIINLADSRGMARAENKYNMGKLLGERDVLGC